MRFRLTFFFIIVLLSFLSLVAQTPYDSTQPVEQPTQPVEQPTQPVEQPTQPVEQPTQPVEQPTLPVVLDSEMDAFCFLDALPARTLMVVGCHNLEQAKQEFNNLHIVQFWQEPEVIHFIQPFQTAIQNTLQKFQQDHPIPEDAKVLHEYLSNLQAKQVFVACVDIDIQNFNSTPPTFILGLENAQGIDALLQHYQQYLMEIEYNGIKLLQVKDLNLYIAIFQKTCMISNTKELPVELITIYQKQQSGRLMENPALLKIFRKLIPENETCVLGGYINCHQVFQLVKKNLSESEIQKMQVLGMDQIENIAFTTNFIGGQIQTRVLMDAGGAIHGIHSFYQGDKIDLIKAARLVPEDALVFSTHPCNLVTFLDRVGALLGTLDAHGAPGYKAKYDLGIQFGELVLGFTKADLAQSFGSPVVSTVLYHGPGLLPDHVMMIPVLDRSKAEKCISEFAKFASIEIKQHPLYPEIQYLCTSCETSDFLKKQKLLPRDFAFTISGCAFTYQQDMLYFSTSVSALRAYCSWQAANGSNILQSPTFQATLARAPEHCLAFHYVDAHEAIERGLDTSRVILRKLEGVARRLGIPIETALFPHPTTISKYFSNYVVTLSLEPEGLMLSTRGPVDLLGVAVLGTCVFLTIEAGEEFSQRPSPKEEEELEVFTDEEDNQSTEPTEPTQPTEPTEPTEPTQENQPVTEPTIELGTPEEPEATTEEPEDTEEPEATPEEPEDTEEPEATPDEPEDTEEPEATTEEPEDTEEPEATTEEPEDTEENTVEESEPAEENNAEESEPEEESEPTEEVESAESDDGEEAPFIDEHAVVEELDKL